MTEPNVSDRDPYDLERFVSVQVGAYAAALKELKSGRKETHWMWFVFPQVEGLGTSVMARRYAIRSRAEAVAYLEHPVLGPRLAECVESLLRGPERSATEIMGQPDDRKLHSSLTLFAAVAKESTLYEQALKKFYRAERDEATLERLRSWDDCGKGDVS